jgi:hypothetical protein
LASVARYYAEWYVPSISFEPVTVPKKMLGMLFEFVPKEKIDELAIKWATESRNIVLLSGISFSIETAIAFTYRVSKYFMCADAKLVKGNNGDIVSSIIRHDNREKFSYFCARCFYHFYDFFQLKQVAVDHDASLVYIKIDLTEDEVEAMKRYVDSVQEEIRKAKEKRS